MEEDKRTKFVRIAENRTNKIINMIRLLGNCSNKSTYEYFDKDIDKIFSALESELKEAKKRFQNNDTKRNGEFKLC